MKAKEENGLSHNPSSLPCPPETEIKNKKRNRNIARETRESAQKRKDFLLKFGVFLACLAGKFFGL